MRIRASLGSLMTVAAVAALTAAILALMLLRPAIVARADRSVYDIFLREMAAGGGAPSDVPIIIDIDEKSIQALGQWPWPRFVMAEIFTALYEGGVDAIGVDILMTEQDRTSPSSIAAMYEDYFGISIDIRGEPPELEDHDAYLASIIRQMPVALSVHVTDAGTSADAAMRPIPITELRAPDAPPLSHFLPSGSGVLAPIPVLMDAASCVAVTNSAADADGMYRHVPLFVAGPDGEPIPGLALSALALAGGEGLLVYVSPDGPESVSVTLPASAGGGRLEIPISRGGTIAVAYRGPRGTVPTYSAIDVLNGDVPPEKLRGRIAFVGSTASGLLDLRPTPLDSTYPGLEMHAAALDTILSRRFITEPGWTLGANVIIVAAAGAICAALFGAARPWQSFAICAALIAAIWYGCRALIETRGIYISPFYGIAAVLCHPFLAFSMRFGIEENTRRLLRRAFSNYVSPEIVGRIVEEGSVASLRGEMRRITVLFTDLRGFTTMTERMAPTEVSAMLGSYFSPMTALVRASGGTLDKFVGDALMAFWNAPLDVPAHEAAAVRALMDMHTALERLNGEVFGPRFGTSLRMGGGIHTGDAHVGNMGTEDLMNYTAVGDTVNTASRLEGLCSKYGVGIAVSEVTAAALDPAAFALRRLDLVRVKGRHSDIAVYSVHTPEEAAARAEEFALWDRAFGLYLAGDFAATADACAWLIALRPGEKLYELLAERAEKMRVSPPAEWDGVFTYQSK